jgi:U3 small nucleolar RNA-associated protein 13
VTFQIKGVGELLEGLIPYSQRHFGRIDRLVRSTFLLDFILSGMSVIEPDTQQTESKDEFPLWPEIDTADQQNGIEEKDHTIENKTASKKRKSNKSKPENEIEEEDQTLENDTASKKRKSKKSKHGSHKKVKDVAYNKVEPIQLQA